MALHVHEITGEHKRKRPSVPGPASRSLERGDAQRATIAAQRSARNRRIAPIQALPRKRRL